MTTASRSSRHAAVGSPCTATPSPRHPPTLNRPAAPSRSTIATAPLTNAADAPIPTHASVRRPPPLGSTSGATLGGALTTTGVATATAGATATASATVVAAAGSLSATAALACGCISTRSCSTGAVGTCTLRLTVANPFARTS